MLSAHFIEIDGNKNRLSADRFLHAFKLVEIHAEINQNRNLIRNTYFVSGDFVNYKEAAEYG
jgi:hypothetical protein